jgi:hypothetical protein
MFSIKPIVLGGGVALMAAVLPVTQGRSLAHPADDLAGRAFAILETNCANSGCHGGPGYYRFDVRDTATLHDARVITAGNAGESEIIRRVESGSMPLGGYKRQVGARLPDADIAVLRRWIDAGAPATPVPLAETRPAIAERQILTAILQDLQAQPQRDRRFVRYFSYANIWNRHDVPGSDLAAYPVAVSKLIHHLSWERTITQPKPLGPENTVLRIDLRDYGWTNETWRQIEAAYPYDLADSGLLRDADLVDDLSEAAVPYMRVDWFLANSSVAPLYHEILKLPDTLKGLENLLRIDSATDVQVGRARRFGLRNSAVSRNNRAVERSPTAFGSFWKSFDFASSRLGQNIFVDPINLHPDGGEMIFTLPNGLQGYFIADKNGRRIDDAPVSIVRDRANSEDPVVRNGRSCIGCHVQGINGFHEEVSGTLSSRRDATFDLFLALDLYRGQQELDRLVREDSRLFNDALLRIGSRAAQGSGTELINSLARRHEASMTTAQAAAEVFLDAAELQRKVARRPDLQAQGFDQLLGPDGGIKRDTWEQGFRALIRETEARVADGTRQEVPGIVLTTNLGPDLIHHVGDDVVISMTASADGFLGLFGIDSRGTLRQVKPAARITANQTIRVVDPTRRSNRILGVETLIGVASASPIPQENQRGWDSFSELLRTWAASSSAPKRSGDREVAIMRYLTAP